MIKQWYINVDGKNKGPFTTPEIQALFRSGDVGDFTLCWKEGLASWTPYFKLEFDATLQALPDIPNLPPVPADELPAIPQEVIKKPQTLKRHKKTKIENIELVEANEAQLIYADEKELNTTGFPVYSFAASVVMTLGFIIFTYLILIPSSKRSIIFKNVSLDTLNYLEGKIDKDKFYIKFGLDKSGEVIFGRSNLSKNANVRVIFERVTDNMNADSISFTSSSVIRDGDLKFDDFEFISGDKIEQGKYKVKASARIEDALLRLKNFILGRVGEFEFEEEVYLIPSTLEDYKTNLSKIKVNSKLEQTELLLSLEQKIQTVDSILTSMALHYRLSINLNYGKNASAEFEKRYHSQSGPLLQSIILEDYEKLFTKSEQKLILQELGAKIHNHAKDIAALSSTLSEDLKMIWKLTPKTRLKLREDLSIKVNELKQITEEIKSDLSLALDEIKNTK